ncbi:MAG: lysophospholipid acyltransferase family protein [Acidobacteriota bacterium]
MRSKLKVLSLSDLILNRKGTITFRLMLAAFGIALRFFFRRIETVNAENVPKQGGLIFVLNHPNGLIDPAMVFVSLPRRISFLAKSTLFRVPVISYLLKRVDALPLYRRIDAGEDVTQNQRTFVAARKLLQKGGSIALFPEGVSHNSPKMLPAKTGAARIALGAASVNSAGEQITIQFVPVGLFYTNKTTFRSEAVLHFGKPFAIEPVALESDGEPPRDAVQQLTGRIEDEIREVTLNAETDAELESAYIAERIFATASESDLVGERLEFLKNYVGDKRLQGSDLEARIEAFDCRIADSGLEPEHLSLAQFSTRFVVWQAFIQTWALIIFSPLAVVGTVLHFPAYQICKLLARVYAKHGADDIASTVKVLAGMLFVPLTWLITAVILYFFFGWIAAIVSIPLSFICGYAALYFLEETTDLSGWARALWMLLTKKEKFLRLYIERRDLQNELTGMHAS